MARRKDNDRRNRRRSGEPGRRREDLEKIEIAGSYENTAQTTSSEVSSGSLTDVFNSIPVATIEAYRAALSARRGKRQISADQSDIIVFHVRDQLIGIELSHVEEVRKIPEIVEVPGAPPGIMGIVNLRGKMIPIWDTKEILGLGESKIPEAGRLILVKHENEVHGLLADFVEGVVRVKKSSIEDPPPFSEPLGSVAKGVIRRDNGMVILLTAGVIFGK
ncbi:MAG: purine-binding chemotaxis protein CheW [Deltaproteobacteria bacterium]|nr:purine-binding chemotaxis protein CheW [Deltaproteobacteria bacterium]